MHGYMHKHGCTHTSEGYMKLCSPLNVIVHCLIYGVNVYKYKDIFKLFIYSFKVAAKFTC